MKKLITTLLGLSLVLTPWAASVASEGAERVEMKHLQLVVLDPGHGGSNRGCLGVDGTYEKQVVLEIAERVARILRHETTATVRMTRTEDRFLGLRERTRMANRWGADVFLSLHVNADPAGVGHGVETWHLAHEAVDEEARRLVEKEEGHVVDFTVQRAPLAAPHLQILEDARVRRAHADAGILAELVHDGMHQETQARARGVKQAPFGVLKEAQMPAIVVEAGFFSHAEQGVELLSERYQEQVARGIVDGIIAYDRRTGGDARPHRSTFDQTASAH